jgi:NAD(P)-dependent dehydrogenase (short-subunit alcohol dehydrogenase family)
MSLTRSMALECGRFGIRVNAIAPGPVETPAASTATLGESANRVTSMIPLGRRASLDDIGDATLFLASPMASYITGQTLVVDGGLTLRFPIPLPGSDATEAP